MIPVQSQVTQSNSEEAKKLFGKYTLQGLLDELDIIECLKQPGNVIGKQKCNDFGKMICSKIGNNGTMFSATRVQYYWQQSCSTSKGSIFLIDSSFFK